MVKTALGHEFFVVALLPQYPFVDDVEDVTVTDCGQTVGDRDGGSTT